MTFDCLKYFSFFLHLFFKIKTLIAYLSFSFYKLLLLIQRAQYYRILQSGTLLVIIFLYQVQYKLRVIMSARARMRFLRRSIAREYVFRVNVCQLKNERKFIQ